MDVIHFGCVSLLFTLLGCVARVRSLILFSFNHVASNQVLKDVHRGADSNLAAEVAVLNTLKHPNLLMFMGACLDGESKFIVTE